jgi:peptidoglycan/xylan/chitin deacetylase (PgdA/CDA1 family)
MTCALTVVMYHYVQPIDAGPVRGLNLLELSTFERQLAHIRRHYTVISADAVVRAVDGREPLPPRPLLLTFDDGYKGHHTYVLPLLHRWSLPAVFFPVAGALLDRQLLDVNKIQALLAVTADVESLAARIDAVAGSAAYRATWWKASDWDTAPAAYVKRMLQHALPPDVRSSLVETLFRENVSGDERAFAEQLYMTVDDVRELLAAGMAVGAHADRHLRLTTLDRDGQGREIDGALRVLEAIGLPRRPFFYCYAHGDYDETSLSLLTERGCALAFTTRREVARVDEGRRLEVPRLDTNDLAVDVDAEL